MNLLEYRTCVGLALTYLRMNLFDKARSLLQESLPHAPRLPTQGHRGTRTDRREDEGYEFAVEETPVREPTFEELVEAWGGPRPKTEQQWFLDYKSYSYRPIGHIYACQEDYDQAVTVLHLAVDLSPHYADAQYDYAQYCALVGRKEDALASFRKAIELKPLFGYPDHFNKETMLGSSRLTRRIGAGSALRRCGIT